MKKAIAKEKLVEDIDLIKDEGFTLPTPVTKL